MYAVQEVGLRAVPVCLRGAPAVKRLEAVREAETDRVVCFGVCSYEWACFC